MPDIKTTIRKTIRTVQTHFPGLLDPKFAVQREMRRRLRRPHERDFEALRYLPAAPNQLFLDVGANRGQSIDSIRLYGEEREIHALEPNPILCDRLDAMFADTPGVRIRNFGLGDADGTFPLYVPYYRGYMFDGLASFDENSATWWLRNGALYGFRPELLRVEVVICKTKRLDDLNLAPFFIKLDVQGFEFHALVGGEQTIAQCRPILLIEAPKQPEINLLRRHGYDIYRYAGGRLIKGQRGAPNSFFLTPDKADLVADRCEIPVVDSRLNGLVRGVMRPQGGKLPSIARIRALVLENLERTGIDASSEAVRVTVAELKRPNWHSIRAGCAVTVWITDRHSRPRSIELWVKYIGQGRTAGDAFEAMDAVYRQLQNANLQSPMPKPFFVDRASGLIFMERIEGENLLTQVLKNCIYPGKYSHPECCRTFGSIGRWLSEFHNVTANGRTTNIVSMLPGLESHLSQDIHFGVKEKARLRIELERVVKNPIAHLDFPVAMPHNDITLRNIFVTFTEFHVVDWDAMVHPSFPRSAICWWDLTTLIMSIESLLRFHPVLNKRRLEELCNALWKGYVDGIIAPSFSLEEFRTTIMFALALRYYSGLGSDRPAYRIYRKRLGWRYTRALRRELLLGRGSLF